MNEGTSGTIRRRAAAHGIRCCTVAVLALTAGTARAQTPAGGPCSLEFENTPTTRVQYVRQSTGEYNSYVGGGVIARCAGQPVVLRSDSAEYYAGRNVLFLLGSVRYEEPRATVSSRRMTYLRAEERLIAEGDVVATLPTGTTMRGPVAEYFRQTQSRVRAQLIATGRPRVQLVQRDATGRPAEPVALVADRIFLDGDSLAYAGGKVEITRTDIDARADSAFLDGGREFARLMRSPSIVSRDARPFRLAGGVIDLYSRARELERVLAAPAAKATSDNLELTADTIDLRVVLRKLERAYAWGPTRARAVASSSDIVADSIDAQLPGQQLREVRALRRAIARTTPDTLRIRSGERDWLAGDTIVASFDRAVRADTSTGVRLSGVVATGGARAYVQIASRAGDRLRPAINYVRGRMVTVALLDGTVESVTVVDSATGVLLEPTLSAASANPPVRADTTARATNPPAVAPARARPAAPTPAPRSPATPARKPAPRSMPPMRP